MENWPTAILPEPSRLNYGNDQQPGGSTRTEMDSGRILQRQRFTTDVKQMPVRWFFSDFQYAMFQSWFKYKVHNGNDYFMAYVPMGDGMNDNVKVRFVNAVYKARWVESNSWEVTGTLETDEPPIVSEEIFDLFADDLEDSLTALEGAATDLHTCVHTHLPLRFY